MNGYVIEYGKAQKVFVEEGLYIAALECLKSLGHRVQVAQWVDHLDDAEVNVLDAKSFGYIIEYVTDDSLGETKRVFVPSDELEDVTEKMYNEGYKPILSCWTNCILNPAADFSQKTSEEVCSTYGAATEEQVSNLKTLCKELMDKDETQEDFVHQIATKTEDFKYITASACTALCDNLRNIIAHYGE